MNIKWMSMKTVRKKTLLSTQYVNGERLTRTKHKIPKAMTGRQIQCPTYDWLTLVRTMQHQMVTVMMMAYVTCCQKQMLGQFTANRHVSCSHGDKLHNCEWFTILAMSTFSYWSAVKQQHTHTHRYVGRVDSCNELCMMTDATAVMTAHRLPSSVMRIAQQWRYRLACQFIDVVLPWFMRFSSATTTNHCST